MITFFIALVILIVGYMTYGVVVEKAFKPDDRPTPAIEYADGVDFVEMKPWRIFLIQLLNIQQFDFAISSRLLRRTN